MFSKERDLINLNQLGLLRFLWIFFRYILVIVFFDSVVKLFFYAGSRTLNISGASDISVSSANLVAFVTSTLAGCAFSYSLIRKYFPESSGINSLIEVGLRRCSIRICFLSVCIGICMAIIFEKYMQASFPAPAAVISNSGRLLGQSEQLLKPYYLLISVGIGPIAEELFFRGFLYKAFSPSWGKAIAGSVVTIVFVLLHFRAFQYWVALTSLVLGSIVLLLLREKSDSLIPPILMHQFYNAGVGIWG